jgi:hypothetical protein
MNKEKQRIAIAEACGWKNADHPDAMELKQGWSMPEKWCMDPKGVLRFNHHRPDYLNDLNAMHEAEEHLDVNQKIDYASLITRHFLDEIYHVIPNDLSFHICFPAIHVNPEVRAEAFLRTVGKWEDDK